MNQALESLLTDLIAAGVALHDAREVRRVYADALSRKDHAYWVAFYRAVYAALHRMRADARRPEPERRVAARASLLLLVEDDLGAALFSQSEIADLRSPRESPVVHGGTATPRLQSFAYERI
jgi:hypothetical protein